MTITAQRNRRHNDCWGVGARMEWWQADAITGYDYGGRSAAAVDTTSYYELTVGVNYRPNANVVLRPEYRFDWAPALGYEEGTFGIDWIVTY